MELRQLRYFVKAAELLNFSEAAKAVCVTQSTLSQQIRQLEIELDTQLFERNSHAVALTEEGEALLPAAIKTLYSADTCRERIDDLRRLTAGTLNIGVTYSFSPILTETVIEFMKHYPNVKLNIHYKTMEELMRMLSRREVDFVLAFRPSRHYDDIESHLLFDNHLSAIVGENHPLASRSGITLSELEQHDLALPAKGLQARNAFDQLTSGRDHRWRVRIELNEVNILLKLVSRSNLVTILSEASIYDIPGVKAIPIKASGNEMAGCVHVLRNTYRKHSASEFMRMLCRADAVLRHLDNWF